MADSTHHPLNTWYPPMGKALLAAFVGGIVAFAILSLTYPFFEATILPEMTLNPSDEEVAKFIAAHTSFYSQNYAVALAIVGACLGVCFVGMTITEKKVPSSILAGVLGAAGAGIAGYFAGQVTGIELAWSKDQVMYKQALISFAIWGAMLLGLTLGGTMLLGNAASLPKYLVVALIAAILVVVANILIFSIAFPSVNLSNHVPDSLVERGVWLVVASLAFGATMSAGLKPTPSKQEGASESLGVDGGDDLEPQAS